MIGNNFPFHGPPPPPPPFAPVPSVAPTAPAPALVLKSLHPRVSVWADVQGSCLKGAKHFEGEKCFVGNGVSRVSREDLFKSASPATGVGVRMEERLYDCPRMDEAQLPGEVMLQNLPSILAVRLYWTRTYSYMYTLIHFRCTTWTEFLNVLKTGQGSPVGSRPYCWAWYRLK